MTKLNSNCETVEKVSLKIYDVRTSLNVLGVLLEQQNWSTCLEGDELFGLGHILKEFSKELLVLEEALCCDSNTNEVNET